jgi:hypothetical protein
MRTWLRGLGLLVVTLAAIVASFSTLASLAVFTGWGERSSWLLPASLDALGMTACLVWLDGKASVRARRYACWLTWIAAGLSILGNGAGHLASTGHLSQGLLLVVMVGAVPPAALATTVHLIVLVSSGPEATVPDAAPVPAMKPSSAPVPAQRIVPGPPVSPKKQVATKPKPKVEASVPKLDDVDLQRARHADRDHRAATGQPITRDALKAALGWGTGKATVALAALKKEREAA